MDIDGYDGSELAPLNNSQIDNSLTANFNQMFENESQQNEVEVNEQNQLINKDILVNEQIEPMVEQPIKSDNSFTKTVNYIAYFVIIWLILGLISFITSIVCFGFSGSIGEKMIGLLIALLFGPFYWLYFFMNKNK